MLVKFKVIEVLIQDLESMLNDFAEATARELGQSMEIEKIIPLMGSGERRYLVIIRIMMRSV